MDFRPASKCNTLQGKTPVSYLQEMCARMGAKVQYELVEEDRDQHSTSNLVSFTFKVKAGEKEARGNGMNKKQAKHNAALSLLREINPDLLTGGNHVKTSDLPSDDGLAVGERTNVGVVAGGAITGDVANNSKVNCVGQLQEFAQKNLLGMPTYSDCGRGGPSHAPCFICKVTLKDLTFTAEGPSKKLAKHNAAERLLAMIHSGGSSAFTSQSGTCDSNPSAASNTSSTSKFMSVSQLEDTFSSLSVSTQSNSNKPLIQTITPVASQTISRFYRELRSSPGPASLDPPPSSCPSQSVQSAKAWLASLNLSDVGVNYESVLQEVARRHKFDATYVDVAELSPTGRRFDSRPSHTNDFKNGTCCSQLGAQHIQ